MSTKKRIEELEKKIVSMESMQESIKNLIARIESVLEITDKSVEEKGFYPSYGIITICEAIERLERYLGIELVDVPGKKEYRKIKKAKK